MLSPDLASVTPATSVGQSLEMALGPLGYERIEKPEEAERHFVAAVVAPWVSLFDLANPGVITDELVALGKRLSATSRCPVLLTSVLDSDAFAFLLFENGKQVDGHASTRGLLPGRIKKWVPEIRAREWGRLFVRQIDQNDLLALTEKGLLFADDLLLRLCGLVGLSRDLATRTPRDLQAQPWPNQQEFYFRSRPGSAGELRVKQTVAYKGPTMPLEIPLGGQNAIPFELNGPAGAFRDPVLEFSGPAVDAGLVALSDRDYGTYGRWALGLEAIRAGDIRTVHAVLSSEETDGRRVLRASLQGLSAERFAFAPRKQSILIYWSCLRGLCAGTGEMRVVCLPNPSAGERLLLRPALLVEVRAAV
jgi:hypothetical protein